MLSRQTRRCFFLRELFSCEVRGHYTVSRLKKKKTPQSQAKVLGLPCSDTDCCRIYVSHQGCRRRSSDTWESIRICSGCTQQEKPSISIVSSLSAVLAPSQHSQWFFILFFSWSDEVPVHSSLVCNAFVSVCRSGAWGETGYVIPCDIKGKFVSALWHFLLLWKCGLPAFTSPAAATPPPINKSPIGGEHAHD